MENNAFRIIVISACIMALPALVAAQADSSRSTGPVQSSARSSVPTGDPLTDRKAVDEEKSGAPAPKPRVKDGGDAPPVIPVPPVAPPGD